MNTFYYTLLLFLTTMVTTYAQEDNAKVYISTALYEVSFDKNRSGDIHAKLKVRRNFVSQTESESLVSERVFFDNKSKVKKVKARGVKRSPIISDYESNGIFHSDLKLCYIDHLLKGKGDKVTLSYEKEYYDVKYLDPMYFVDVYEVDESVIEIEVPEWLDLNIIEWNFDQDSVEKSVRQDGKSVVYTYTMRDLNSFAGVAGLPNRSKIYPHLILNPVSATIKKQKVNLLRDAGDLYAWYASLVDQIGNDTEVLEPLVAELIAGKQTDIEKIQAIYYWVQDNIRYIAFEEGIMGFRPEACQRVYSNRYGDCKGMANLTKEMLKIAGYDARLTWIGTSSLPYDYSVPSLIVDNHMICSMELDGKRIYLDATEKFADLFYNASRIQGKQVMIEDGEQYIIDRVPEDPQANSEKYTLEVVIAEEKLLGDAHVSMSGGRKDRMAYRLSEMAAKDHHTYVTSYLSNKDKNVVVDLPEELPSVERDRTYDLDYDIRLDNHVFTVGDELYFNPEFDYAFQRFEKFEDRDIPYDLSEVAALEMEMKIAIPSGYDISYLPGPVSVAGDGYSFDLSYNADGDHIHYVKKINITKETLQPVEFNKWNTVIDELKTIYADQVILKKL